MSKPQLTPKSYPSLLARLKEVFIDGLRKIEAEKVKAYWLTGELICNHILENKGRAGYGDDLFEKLSGDLGVDARTLQRTVRFFRAFPIPAARPELTWSHYRALITVENKAKRKLFARRAADGEWDYRRLEEAIRLDRLKIAPPADKPTPSSGKLSVVRSRLYAYRVLEPAFIHPVEERPVIDLGFAFLIQAETRGIRLKAGEIIESVKTGKDYSFKHSDAGKKELYAYKALVERVVDADTAWLNVDLGFDCWSRQKARLRGIDAPELSTQKGMAAKEAVEARLKEAAFVIIKTHQSDKYDRYLADVFYSPRGKDAEKVLKEGVFLNQELLDLGLAERMD
jgi:endonuclease YncB( thermonuclease family)